MNKNKTLCAFMIVMIVIKIGNKIDVIDKLRTI